MKIKALIAALAALCATGLVVASVAAAGGVTITTDPNPTTVSGTFSATVCGTGGRTVEVRVTAPDGSTQNGQGYGPNCFTIGPFDATQAGTYTVEVLNKSGKNVLASTTETVV